MPDYLYRAVDIKGHPVNGSMFALDEKELDNSLQKIGYWLIEADIEKKEKSVASGKEKVSRKELMDFFNGMYSLLAAGIPVATALISMAEETDDETFARVLKDVQMNVEAGSSLDIAMQRHPKIFSSQIINLIKAGEYAGNLETSCEDITAHLEWVDSIMADIKQASIYPIIILCAVMGLVFLMFFFVVPRFKTIFDSLNLDLPMLTQIVIQIGDFTTQYWWFLLSLPVGIFLFFKHVPQHFPRLAVGIDRFKLNVPVFGQLNRMIIQSRFCHNMGLLLKAGVPIIEALSLSKGLVGNLVMEKATESAEIAVNEGRKMSEALREHNVISPIVLRMMIVGEETGRLDEALKYVSLRFDKEVPRQIKRVFSVLEPMIMMTLIFIVGMIGGAVFLPMFGMMSGIGG
jgi:type IV pilus assembly protein PilC